MNYINTISHEKLMSKYWAAKEITSNLLQLEVMRVEDRKKFSNYLTQLLKKEWFRND